MRAVIAACLALSAGCAGFWQPSTPGTITLQGRELRCGRAYGVQVWAEEHDCPNMQGLGEAVRDASKRFGIFPTDLQDRRFRIVKVPMEATIICGDRGASHCSDGWTILAHDPASAVGPE